MIDIRPVGDTALLLELESNAAVHDVAAAARERWHGELADVVPGHRTVLVVWAHPIRDSEALIPELRALAVTVSSSDRDHSRAGPAANSNSYSDPSEAASAELLTIRVRYDGTDLGAVARQLGMSEDEVVALHSAGAYTVAFMGFAPGFPYLVEHSGSEAVAELLALPRLASPRTEVPAGSVAVAAGYCGVYPRSSPGGWNLLGSTEIDLFDPAREPPALLTPGASVRFNPE
jgi:KipI family sensor histidine kinase inhibitor